MIPSFLTLLGSTAVSLGAGIGRSLGILRQVILSRPVKDITPVLRETTDPLILKTTHVVCNVCVCVRRKNISEIHYITLQIQPCVFFHPLLTENEWQQSCIITSAIFISHVEIRQPGKYYDVNFTYYVSSDVWLPHAENVRGNSD